MFMSGVRKKLEASFYYCSEKNISISAFPTMPT